MEIKFYRLIGIPFAALGGGFLRLGDDVGVFQVGDADVAHRERRAGLDRLAQAQAQVGGPVPGGVGGVLVDVVAVAQVADEQRGGQVEGAEFFPVIVQDLVAVGEEVLGEEGEGEEDEDSDQGRIKPSLARRSRETGFGIGDWGGRG